MQNANQNSKKEIQTSEVKEAKYYHKFLLDKKVLVKPVDHPEKWQMLTEDRKKAPFMYPKAKRSYTVPNDRLGNIVRVLDNTKEEKSYYTAEFPNEKLTEEEYIGRLIDRDLSIYKKEVNGEVNFWKRDKLATVKITTEVLELDLSSPIHYLHWKILLSNNRLIAPSEGYLIENFLPSYEYVIVDKQEVKKRQDAKDEIKKKAMLEYFKIESNVELLTNLIRVQGKVPVDNKKETIQNEVFQLVDTEPKEFLNIISDEQFEVKILLIDAVKYGAIRKTGIDMYELASGIPIGNKRETLGYLNEPENLPIIEKIKHQIKSSK